MRQSLPCLVAMLLSACSLGPRYAPPVVPVPAKWSVADGLPPKDGADAGKRLASWWMLFNDPELNSLVNRALRGNLDLRAAADRVEQSRAQYDYVASGMLPTISGSVYGDRQRLTLNDKFPPFGGVFNTFHAGFDASWEPDIFGRIKGEKNATSDLIEAQEDQRQGAVVTLLGDLGSNYASLRAAQNRLRIAQRNIAVQSQLVDLTQQRFSNGLATELDLDEATAQLDTLQAVLPDLQDSITESSHAIAVLLGQNPGTLDAELSTDAPVPVVPPALPATIPSEVMHNRPDIRAAERQVAAYTALIGVAKADYYPSFSISPGLSVEAGYLHKVLNAGSLGWTLPVSADIPIFTAGKTHAEVASARTETALELVTYQKTVLTAFRDVEDSLSAWRAAHNRSGRLEAAATANQAALDRATDLYRNGLGDFITVLTNERALYTAQDDLAISQDRLVQATIAFYKALGNGWQAGSDGRSLAQGAGGMTAATAQTVE